LLGSLFLNYLEDLVGVVKQNYPKKGSEIERLVIAFAKYISKVEKSRCNSINLTKFVESLSAIGIGKKDIISYALTGLSILIPKDIDKGMISAIGQKALDYLLCKYPNHVVYEKCDGDGVMLIDDIKLRPVGYDKEEIKYRLKYNECELLVNVDNRCFDFSP